MTSVCPADPIVVALRLALAEVAACRAAEKARCVGHGPAGAANGPAPVSLATGLSIASQRAPREPGRASQDGPRAAQTLGNGGREQNSGQTPSLNGGDGLGGSIADTAAAAIRAGQRNVRSMKMQAIYRREWDDALTMMRRPNRLPALWRWFHAGKITAAELNKLLRSFWSATEGESRRPDEHWLGLTLFRAAGFVTEGADLLPGDPLTIYRGQDADRPPGLSWTLDREKAERFARRFKSPAPTVLVGTVARANVLGYFSGRDEAEVVADPADVAITARMPLSVEATA
jgi:hypothetical protein